MQFKVYSYILVFYKGTVSVGCKGRNRKILLGNWCYNQDAESKWHKPRGRTVHLPWTLRLKNNWRRFQGKVNIDPVLSFLFRFLSLDSVVKQIHSVSHLFPYLVPFGLRNWELDECHISSAPVKSPLSDEHTKCISGVFKLNNFFVHLNKYWMTTLSLRMFSAYFYPFVRRS